MEHLEAGKPESDAAALNQALVDDLKNRGLIQSPRVEAAFRAVMRHLFLPGTPLEEVYTDRAISAKQDAEGKWISSSSQPAMMAIMLEQLGLEPGHTVLEIGTGPGYNAALMAHLVGESGRVVSIEIDEDLAEAAREHLKTAGFEQVQVLHTDGGYGAPDFAPFDRIILTVGAPDITPAWWEQLNLEGRLVLPLMLRGAMKSIAFKQDADHLISLSITDCGFIPLRGDFAVGFSNRIHLGLEPGLSLEALDEFSIDTDRVYSLLTSVHQDRPAELEVTAWDVLNGSLWTWLALHEPNICKLFAEEEMVERNIVPALIGIHARVKSAGTVILLGDAGLAALMRPPGQSLPMVPFEKLYALDSPASQPFPLFVRQFGPDESATRRLLSRIQAWKNAGSPTANNMSIRAYLKDSLYKPSGGEIVLKKQWTKLVIEWPESNFHGGI